MRFVGRRAGHLLHCASQGVEQEGGGGWQAVGEAVRGGLGCRLSINQKQLLFQIFSFFFFCEWTLSGAVSLRDCGRGGLIADCHGAEVTLFIVYV